MSNRSEVRLLGWSAGVPARWSWRTPGSDSNGGSGLGLPIAAEIVHASGGTIDLLPRPGGGLVVAVGLPAAESAADQPHIRS